MCHPSAKSLGKFSVSQNYLRWQAFTLGQTSFVITTVCAMYKYHPCFCQCKGGHLTTFFILPQVPQLTGHVGTWTSTTLNYPSAQHGYCSANLFWWLVNTKMCTSGFMSKMREAILLSLGFVMLHKVFLENLRNAIQSQWSHSCPQPDQVANKTKKASEHFGWQ
jgi:hypothetical protein